MFVFKQLFHCGTLVYLLQQEHFCSRFLSEPECGAARCQSYKTFFKSRLVVSGKTFQPSLKFGSEASRVENRTVSHPGRLRPYKDLLLGCAEKFCHRKTL
jgi:hypothetical protein